MGFENLRYVERGGLVPGDLLAEYVALGERLTELGVEVLEGLPSHRVHGDFGVHNLLWTGNGFLVMDFDDFMIAPAAFDLCWLHVGIDTMRGNPSRHKAARDHATRMFVEGYRELLPLPGDALRHVEALRALRLLWNDAWKRSRLHDPHFRTKRKVVRERAFWNRRLDALRTQLAALRE